MPVPPLKLLYRPVLEALADRKERRLSEIEEIVARQLELTDDDRQEKIKAGQRRLANRVGWSCHELRKYGLINYPRYAFKVITDKGLGVVKSLKGTDKPLVLNGEDSVDPTPSQNEATPEERMEAAASELRKNVADMLLQKITSDDYSPSNFEHLVVDVLVAMEYGGNRENAARVIGKSGDEGIDGVIDQDPLGLDRVYIQAKRWKERVGGSVIRAFAGAMQQKKARKGVLITTSDFAQAAEKAAREIESRIVLINGKRLAELMIEHGIGVSTVSTYRVQRLDEAWFEELG